MAKMVGKISDPEKVAIAGMVCDQLGIDGTDSKAALQEQVDLFAQAIWHSAINRDIENERDMTRYRKDIFLDQILAALQPEIERLVVEARIDELVRLSHSVQLNSTVGLHLEKRLETLTQLNKKEK